MFKPENFFDLTQFSHQHLFEVLENVWEVFHNIKPYLSDINGEIKGTVMDGAFLLGDDIIIGEGSVVEPGAYIKGPCIIGKNTEVRQGAYIRGNVIVGDGCVVGHATEIKHSIMLDGAKAGHFAYIGDSILGNEVNLGAGTKLANLKITNDQVVIIVDKAVHETGLRKLGAILGDGVQTGCNTVTAPGTIVGKDSLIYSLSSIKGYIEPNRIVKLRQKQQTIVKNF
jgi:NDP-sugar pyrophosphorylase family protein